MQHSQHFKQSKVSECLTSLLHGVPQEPPRTACPVGAPKSAPYEPQNIYCMLLLFFVGHIFRAHHVYPFLVLRTHPTDRYPEAGANTPEDFAGTPRHAMRNNRLVSGIWLVASGPTGLV